MVRTIIPFSRQTIRDDYGIDSLKKIDRYESFCCVPSHLNFKLTIGNCYNRYHPLSHSIAKGDFPNIELLLFHLFPFHQDLIYDYLQLLFIDPTQKLPIISLVSQDRNTGKSTFGFLLQDIFEENSVSVGNRDLSSAFNGVYADKLLIIIDEAYIEEKSTIEMIKRLSTEKGGLIVNEKNVKQSVSQFFGKFIMMSNNELDFTKIDESENRFFVVKVNSINNDIPDMRERMRQEIPAFLFFLQNRKLVHSRMSRFFFKTDLYLTEHLQEIIEESRNELEKSIEEIIRETFRMAPFLKELYFSEGDLYEEIRKSVNVPRKSNIRKTLKTRFKKCQYFSNGGRYEFYSLSAMKEKCLELDSYSLCESDFKPRKGNNRYYLVKVQDFIF